MSKPLPELDFSRFIYGQPAKITGNNIKVTNQPFAQTK